MARKSIIFGPVLSRRLGYSLGIDLLLPKTCNLDCLYCEVGRTAHLTNERGVFVSFDQIIREIKACNHTIDYLTITGSGEPTLHQNLDELIGRLQSEFPYPVVLITNSLLLNRPQVRKEILELDILMPSLDAATQQAFEQINRPQAGTRVEEIIQGLVDFRHSFKGKIWLEILFVKGVNDSSEDIRLLKKAIKRIQPDKIQLNTVVRPPAFRDLAIPLPVSQMEDIAKALDDPRVELLSTSAPGNKGITLSESELVSYLSRRPAHFEELARLFNAPPGEVRQLLLNLEHSGKIRKEIYAHELFFRATGVLE